MCSLWRPCYSLFTYQYGGSPFCSMHLQALHSILCWGWGRCSWWGGPGGRPCQVHNPLGRTKTAAFKFTVIITSAVLYPFTICNALDDILELFERTVSVVSCLGTKDESRKVSAAHISEPQENQKLLRVIVNARNGINRRAMFSQEALRDGFYFT